MPECFVDTMLVQTLVPPKRNTRYNHQHGCFAVSNEMQLHGLKDKFAVGLIDNDKKKAKYLKEFAEVDTIEGLRLYKHPDCHQYFIEVSPAVETWILKVCQTENIDITSLGLPNDITNLKKITKSSTSSRDRRFVELFSVFLTSGNQSVLTLKRWITLLKEKNYRVGIKELRNE